MAGVFLLTEFLIQKIIIMKKLIFYLLVLCFITTVEAQVTELEETTVFLSQASELPSDIDDFTLVVKENYVGEFEENPLGFMKSNFDIHEFIDHIEKEYDTYIISFRSDKGYLNAEFDKDGEIQKNDQVFRNILIPRHLMRTLYRDHKGWTMVKNKYVAGGDGDKIDRGFYKIKLEQDNRSKKLKFDLVPTIAASDLVSQTN